MRFVSWTSRVLLVLTAVGCGSATVEPVASTPSSKGVVEQSEPTASEATAPNVQVDIKSWEEIQAWVAGQRGKVVVIDVWSTYCVPCVKEFPQFVQLHKAFQADVACASINIDYYGGDDEQPEGIQPQVLKFLTSKQASMQNFISSDPDEDILNHINTAAPPVAIVYGRDGKLHTIFNNDKDTYGPEGFNYEDDIVPVVKSLLVSEQP